MKAEIHPSYDDITVTCSCGNSFKTRSTTSKDMTIEVCSQCHPFFTGEMKFVDTQGRVERFQAKMKAAKSFSKKGKKADKKEGSTSAAPQKSLKEMLKESK